MMRISNNLGAILLSVWLILTGLVGLTAIEVQGLGMILAILAIGAGIALLLPMTGRVSAGRASASFVFPRLGAIFLAIWLFFTGLFPLANLNFPQSTVLMPLLALAAGVLILLGR
jgi:hypothetical protein